MLRQGKGVELYERGYGKDAAGIAKDAILYGVETRLRWEGQGGFVYALVMEF